MMQITVPESRIDVKAVRAWRISGLFFILPLIIAAIALYFYVGEIRDIPLIEVYFVAGLIFLASIVLILPRVRWNRWRYQINEEDIDLQRGIIITRRTLIPINRIQHVDNRQGPIYKMFGLSSVTVSTAATTHEIPALNDEIAEQVRHNISKFVNKAREDV